MFTESMPTRTAPPAMSRSVASFPRQGCSGSPYRSVRQCRSHPVRNSTAWPSTSSPSSASAPITPVPVDDEGGQLAQRSSGSPARS